jgi:hypothetical protein
MKLNLLSLLTVLLIGSITPTRTNADPVSDSPVTANSLEQLQAEYERRRADALRPVTAWYRAQLEILGHQIEKERTKVAETFWQDDQPELKQALLSPGWVWRSAEDAEGVALTFLRDGSVHHAGDCMGRGRSQARARSPFSPMTMTALSCVSIPR